MQIFAVIKCKILNLLLTTSSYIVLSAFPSLHSQLPASYGWVKLDIVTATDEEFEEYWYLPESEFWGLHRFALSQNVLLVVSLKSVINVVNLDGSMLHTIFVEVPFTVSELALKLKQRCISKKKNQEWIFTFFSVFLCDNTMNQFYTVQSNNPIWVFL